MHDTHGSVLIVEDEADVRESLAAVLESEGYRVIEADNGEAALRQLRGPDQFCLILLDLFMPIMNGWTFREEQLRDPELAEIPVVVITADAAAARRASTLGVADAMTKPLDFDRLLMLVARHC
jgi:CheY-like chemotaxis protein